MDIEKVYSSSLSSMKEAVEGSTIFLMCTSECYYESPSNRLEAEYALKLQKTIIPLVVQETYIPCGWLNKIIGDKIYFKFLDKKTTFDQSFIQLIREIQRNIHDNVDTNSTKMLNGSPLKKKNNATSQLHLDESPYKSQQHNQSHNRIPSSKKEKFQSLTANNKANLKG
jgi:hypothetical protein